MNHPYPLIEDAKDKTLKWFSSDQIKNYKIKNSFGNNLYLPSNIDYKFNNYGFRCDDFNKIGEIPVLFLGCSITHGVGVHQHETWANIIYNKIKQKSLQEFPFWNLSIPNTGIDTQAKCLYWIMQFAKPKYIIGYLPPFFRREYAFNGNIPQTWKPERGDSTFNKIFLDTDFYLHQSERSLMLIDSIREMCGAETYMSNWGDQQDDNNLFKSFPAINYINGLKSFTIDFARDSMHPGPESHKLIANLFWTQLKHKF